MQTVTSDDGTEIAFDRRGDGPPLVLLHGGGTRQFWDPIVPGFTDEYTVVTPDRRGRGDSGDTDPYSLEREVEDVLAVTGAVDGEPVLFGHSFGGLQAIEAARRTDVAAYEPAVIVGEYREGATLAARMRDRLDEGDPEGAMKLHLREVLHGGEISEEAFEAWLEEWPAWPEAVAFAENATRMDREIERYELPATLDVDVPVLLLTGTEGPSHLRDSVHAVHEALPDSRLAEFDGVTHLGPVEAPDRTTAELRSLLEEVPLDSMD